MYTSDYRDYHYDKQYGGKVTHEMMTEDEYRHQYETLDEPRGKKYGPYNNSHDYPRKGNRRREQTIHQQEQINRSYESQPPQSNQNSLSIDNNPHLTNTQNSPQTMSNVVTPTIHIHQPAYGVAPPPRPPDYLVFSCIVFWFCGVLWGAIAMCCSCMSRSTEDIPQARCLGRMALCLNITGIIINVLIGATLAVLILAFDEEFEIFGDDVDSS